VSVLPRVAPVFLFSFFGLVLLTPSVLVIKASVVDAFCPCLQGQHAADNAWMRVGVDARGECMHFSLFINYTCGGISHVSQSRLPHSFHKHPPHAPQEAATYICT
jgi:hypothetical protein